MGRPRQPTRTLQARGAFAKNPQRRQSRENEPEGVGELGLPPADLNARERGVWSEIAALAPWLTGSDRFALEVVCRLEAEWRRKGSEFLASKIGQLRGALTNLGLTPASRSAVKVPTRKPTPTGSEFLN